MGTSSVDDWKNVAWSDESILLLRHALGGGGAVMIWGVFSWHSLGFLIPVNHDLNATAFLSIVSDQFSSVDSGGLPSHHF